jgi:uncharacterized protein YrrD
MIFREDADVFTAEGEKVGEVERVVLDPTTDEATHVVVRKGMLFKEDKVVPVDLIATTTAERVELREDAGDLDKLPPFQEEYYVLVDEDELARADTQSLFPAPVYWYPPIYAGRVGAPPAHYAYLRQPYTKEVERHIPEGTIALKEGAQVISADDEHVGDVAEVLTGPEADEVSHLVIEKGLLLKEQKLIPYHWVSQVGEEAVFLAVGSSYIEGLPDYTE